MTRCFTYMTHGDIASAWNISKSGAAVYLLCIYEVFYRLARLISAGFRKLKVFKIIEAVLIVIVCISVVFVFIIQFFLY